MKTLLTLSLSMLCGGIQLFAQGSYRPAIDIPITNNGNALGNGLAGGLNAPQFSPIDLDGDGTKDLLVYDRAGQVARTFINNGTPNMVDYHFAPEYMSRFPQKTRNFMLARDYNCDGIEDLFFFNQPIGSSGGIAVWQGSRDANNKIQFTEVEDVLNYNSMFGYQPIFIYNPDLPAIGDMDGDGDIDIAAFTLDFTFVRHIYYYKNMSAEQGHGCDSLIMDLNHQCWGLFAEAGTNNTIILSPSTDSCATNPYWEHRNYRHEGSTLTELDYNGDGAMDMLMGDISCNRLNMMTTTDVNDTLLVTQQDALFPVYDVSVNTFSMPGAYILDVDNDGVRDMIAAINETSWSEAVTDTVAWFYRNTQSNTNMVFDFVQKDFLVGDMLDFGRGAAPAFFDYNADGRLDLLVGCDGYRQPNGSVLYGMALLENTGTTDAPAFELVTRNYGNFGNLNMIAMHPTVGDLDNDGDVDLIIGDANGELTYIENTAGAGNTATWASPVPYYQSIGVGGNATPQLFDIDDDGDLDLMVGEDNGYINFFENKGTPNVPSFDFNPVSGTIGMFDLGLMYSNQSAPHFIRQDTTIGLFLGHYAGGVVYLNNINNNVLGTYDTVSLAYQDIYNGLNSKIATADLDGDDTLEIAIGNRMGGITIYQWVAQDTTVSTAPVMPQTLGVTLYPNPAQTTVNIAFQQPVGAPVQLLLLNALGQQCAQQNIAANQQTHTLDISQIPAGIYFVKLQSGNQQQTIKLVKH